MFMQIKAFLTILVLLCCSLVFTLADDALAARLGGGRSFGSKPFMSTPAPAPRPQTTFQNKPSAAQPQAQAAPAARPGGLFGGMGGLMGGLLAGTLIGSLLGGHGFAGGGFMDILLIGLMVFLGLKLFAAFRGSQKPAQASAGAQGYGAVSHGRIWKRLHILRNGAPHTGGIRRGKRTDCHAD